MTILQRGGFGRRLDVQSPFVFAAYHDDRYPKGNGRLGPTEGNIGKWDMYNGEDVPGFPSHPHRGFETITIVEKGIVDHSDGLGASGRYGDGDVQWMTAGKGLQHCEMFPLFNTKEDNELDLFQLWLNLDSDHKMVAPDYKMFWSESIPIVEVRDKNDKITKVKLITGNEGEVYSLEPTEYSWARNRKNNVGIKIIDIEPRGEYTLKKVSETLTRSLYFYCGDIMLIEDEEFGEREYAFLSGNKDVVVKNIGNKNSKLLLMEGEPIRESVAAYGPFVMNTMEEIRQAYVDYGNTGFGGWPFDSNEVVHGINEKRFAVYSNGRAEYPSNSLE